jgi:heme-degrading monooxygenase HmoA
LKTKKRTAAKPKPAAAATSKGGSYIRIWELQAKPGSEAEFERVFGPGGEWENLFKKTKAFLGTEIFRDMENPSRYMLVDRFSSQAAFQQFLEKFRAQYDELDKMYEPLCASDIRVGSFVELP